MPEPRRLPFTLADGMILIAATAFGLGFLRIGGSLGLFDDDPSPANPPGRVWLEQASLAGGCVLASFAIAVVILTLRQPRESRRRARKGPGFVACLLVVLGAILPVFHFVKDLLEAPELTKKYLDVPYKLLFGGLVYSASPLIIGAWVTLALVGRWRPQPTWTDRLGRGIGACWLFFYFAHELYYFGFVPLLRWWGE